MNTFHTAMSSAIARRKQTNHTTDDYFCGSVKGHCHSDECEVREFEFTIQGYGEDLVQRTIRCPLCGSPEVETKEILTLKEYRKEYERTSRMNVNMQKARQAKRQNGEPPILTAYDLCQEVLT